MHLKRLLTNCSMCRADPNVIAYVQRNPFFPAHTYLNLSIMYVKANFTNNSFYVTGINAARTHCIET